jgi:hypothetical protein
LLRDILFAGIDLPRIDHPAGQRRLAKPWHRSRRRLSADRFGRTGIGGQRHRSDTAGEGG